MVRLAWMALIWFGPAALMIALPLGGNNVRLEPVKKPQCSGPRRAARV